MKLFVPFVGFKLRLSAPWKFSLHFESRNDGLLKHFKPELFPDLEKIWHHRYVDNEYGNPLKKIDVELPAGTLLSVDRVYIRADNKNKNEEESYDSLSFRVQELPGVKKCSAFRFWAKLSECNNIEFDEETAEKTKIVDQSKKKLTIDKIKRDLDKQFNYYDILKVPFDVKKVSAIAQRLRIKRKKYSPYTVVEYGDHIVVHHYMWQERFTDLAQFKSARPSEYRDYNKHLGFEYTPTDTQRFGYCLYRSKLESIKQADGSLLRRFINVDPEIVDANDVPIGDKLVIEVLTNPDQTEIESVEVKLNI